VAFQPKPRLWCILLAVGIAFTGLALRLWGIGWSLPNAHHLFSYHPDEGVNLVNGVLQNGVARPHLILGFYNYGTLYFYLWQAAIAVGQTYGLLPSTVRPGSESWEMLAPMLLAGRLVSAVCGVLTLWALYAAGARLYGRKAGLIGAAIYAVTPAAVLHAHFATVDVPATLFVSLALAMAARVLRTGRLRDVVLAGVACGLAAATKYTAVLVVAAPAAAVMMAAPRDAFPEGARRRRVWMVAAHLLVLSLAALAGFVVACPAALLDWPRFTRDVAFEVAKSRAGMGVLFAHTGSGWVYHLVTSMRYGLGMPLLVWCLAAVAYALWRRRPQDILLLAFVAVYYGVIGAAQVRFLRYVIPLFPALALLSAGMVTDWRGRFPQRLTVVAGCLIVVASGITAAALDHVMVLPDVRDQALAYLERTAPYGSTVALATTPWYWTPPLALEFTAPDPRIRREAAEALTRFRVRLPAQGTELDLSVFQPDLPRFVILSDLETEDWQRLDYPPWLAFRAHLAGYRTRVFQNVPRWCGISLGKPAYVPNDMLYIYPRVTVYLR